MFKKILMFGKKGLISYRIKEILCNDVVAIGSDQVNFLHLAQILDALDKFKPDIIINASAYTDVDQAEDEPEIANQINGYALKAIGDWAFQNDSFVIHFSTDYVFDGVKQSGYLPTDMPNPVNAYGRSKLLGEKLLSESKAKHAIFRISWIYDRERGKNFYMTMLKLMSEKTEINVVNDQHGMPTEAKWVAEKICAYIRSGKLENGLFHLSPDGVMTWYDFALLIRNENGFSTIVNPMPSGEYKTKAQRPMWSKLLMA